MVRRRRAAARVQCWRWFVLCAVRHVEGVYDCSSAEAAVPAAQRGSCEVHRFDDGVRAGLLEAAAVQVQRHQSEPRFGGYLMSTRANSSLYLVLRYRGPARVDGDTLARRRQSL